MAMAPIPTFNVTVTGPYGPQRTIAEYFGICMRETGGASPITVVVTATGTGNILDTFTIPASGSFNSAYNSRPLRAPGGVTVTITGAGAGSGAVRVA